MAGDWIRLKPDMETDPVFWQIAARTNMTAKELFFTLYKVCCWFQKYGKYGKAKCTPDVIATLLGRAGFTEAMIEFGWMESHFGVLILKKFCDTSAARKSLGASVRREVLKDGYCKACGETVGLVVDHKIPISRGGSCELENLQSLCRNCNSKKGTLTMEEFLNDRRSGFLRPLENANAGRASGGR